ncbi:MAG: hypothetical protein ACRYFX_30495 [Janthinobacterium lividum]
MSPPLTYNFLQVFWAMFVGWLAGYLFYAVQMVHFSEWHRVTDFRAIFFFTALYAGLSAVIIVPLLFWILRRLGLAENRLAFVVLMTVAAPLALLLIGLLLGGVLTLNELSEYFTSLLALYAAIIGLVFALAYLALRHYQGGGTSTGARGFLLASPALALAFLFYGLPYLAPALAVRYFGDAIAGRAARHGLARFHVGDRLADVRRALPYLVGENVDDGPDSAGYFGGSGYHVAYQDGVITELDLDE